MHVVVHLTDTLSTSMDMMPNARKVALKAALNNDVVVITQFNTI
jgi:hypothetical protein